MKTSDKTLHEWALVSLGQVSDIIMGQSPPSNNVIDQQIGLPFYQGKTDFGDVHPIPTVYCLKPLKIAEPEDILITVRAPVGAVNTNHTRAVIGRGIASIRPHRDRLLSNFLFYVMQSPKISSYWKQIKQGSTFDAINKDSLESLKIPLPPLPVQRRIAEILGSVDSIILVRKTLVEKLRLLMNNIMQDQFSRLAGNRTTIGDIAEVQTGPFGSLLKSSSFAAEGVPVLNIGNVKQGFLDTTSLSFVNDGTATALKNYRLRQGDLLFSRMATVGRTCIVPEDAEGWLMSYHLIRLRIRDENILPQYVMYSLIGSPKIQHQVAIQASGGTRSGVNTSILEGLVIDVPSLDSQKKLVNSLDVIQKRIAHGDVLIKQYETLRDSLLNKLLSHQSREVLTI
ncbi:hypothetical protein BXT84_03050 [Sulfobacillus thermotolerans]|uniref:Type I restriction modification DNA specificity domain-containing protein n=1 Tax=Sulfobacillus thermotolerans TaxID=338644 RepID=A0ABM6RNV6_9FIRM|nr:hypothetical protein BXT84_03050 [Sulfobacillus thermotolerans]